MTTYPYSSTGVSIDKMDSLILATPRKSKMTQILGRIFRLGGDQSVKRFIVDIVDNKITLKSQYSARKKVYTNMDAIDGITDVVVDYDDKINNVRGIATMLTKLRLP